MSCRNCMQDEDAHEEWCAEGQVVRLTAERDALKAELELAEDQAADRLRRNNELANQVRSSDAALSFQVARAEAAEEALRTLDIRRREMRQLLKRLTKYVIEDRAVTPGKTRLERLTAQVIDYLQRTADPNDILRTASAKAEGAGEGTSDG